MSDLSFEFYGESLNQTKMVGHSRQFEVTIDEPPALGGLDEGANPVEYTLAAQAGCLNVVAHLVAQEMGIIVHSLKIHVIGYINPDRLLDGTPDDRAGFKSILVTLEMDSDANDDTLRVWRDILEYRCPVTDNLTNPTPVEIRLSHLSSPDDKSN